MLAVVTNVLEQLELQEREGGQNLAPEPAEKADKIVPQEERLALLKKFNELEHRALQTRVESYTCPITLEVIQDPVVSKYGHSFEKWAISEWIEEHKCCPLTNQPLELAELFPNLHLKACIASDIENYGLDVVSDARMVKNTGLVTIPENLKTAGVEVVSGMKLRELDSVDFYNARSAFIIFPKPTIILGFGATASITLRHNGVAGDFELVSWDRDAVQRSTSAANDPASSGTFVLTPNTKQGFDIQGKFAIEIRSGDCALLQIVDFALSGGGCGNKLGMAGRY
eukprot:TRINITY_DN8396_c0_g1_i1.p1 TRINITY_DN8396_c0_g1~~TRINITY_DN8396_c0_g1_i1.p1  ORF type:complete len:284 (+),score=54.47 TRINITY_DN8396_c0_g1_i1:366-1217(+)